MLFDDLVPASGGGTAPAKGAAPSAVGGTGLFEDLVPAEAPSTERGMGDIFTSALSRGWSQNVGLLTEALPALAYSVAGNDQDAQRKLGEYQARLSEIARTNPAVIENFSKIGSLGDAVTYLAEAVGENLPSMVPGIGAGGAGMIAGRALARNAATKAAAGMTGLTAGAIAGSAAQNIPETFADVAQETGEQRPGVALAFGGLKAGLDAIPSVMALKRAFGPAITDKIAGNILKRMGVGAAEQFAGEGATETGQEALDIAASKYVDENREFFTKENALRIADAGLKGGLGGAALGAGTGAIQRPGAPVSDQPPGQDQGPVLSDTHRQYLREMGLSDQAIDEDLVRAQTWAERIATRKADDQRRAGFGPEGDWEGLAEDAAGVASGEMDPGAQRSVGRVAPSEEPIVVTPDGAAFLPGDLGAVEGAAAAGQVRQNVADNASEAFRLADVKRQKGPAYEAARHYVELTDKIGEDPGQLVERTLQIPAAQFQAMPIPARDRLIQVAMEAQQAQQPGQPMQVQDTSGQGPTSAAPAPMEAAQRAPFRGAAENPRAPVQPTSAEIEATPQQAYTRQGVGGSERPFQAGQDSSGLDFTRDQTGQPVDPRAGFFEQRANEQYEAARKQKAADLEREWAERERAREGRGARFGDAEQAYSQARGGERFSSSPRDLDPEGNYPVDKWGFVVSTKGGPVRYADQRKAAEWIIKHGNRRARDQYFEVENHPSGKGFAVRERGRRDPAPGGRGGPTFGLPARVNPGQPERPSPAAAADAAPVASAASAAEGPTPSAAAPQPAPDSPRGPAAPIADPRPAFADQIRQMRERSKAMDDQAAAIAGNDDKPVVLADKRQHGVLISNDIDEPGKVRLTWFDKDGFSGHTVYNTRQEAIRAAMQSGYADTNRNLLREYSRLDTFKQGNERADQVQREAANPTPKKATPKPKKGRGPQSLWEFIASRGGIKDTDGELKAMGITSKRLVPGAGPLVRAQGLSYDAMREAAEEAGYIQSDTPDMTTTPNDLFNAIAKEAPYWQAQRGTKRKDTRIYAEADQGEAMSRQADRAGADYDRREDLERTAARVGVDYDPSVSDAELERLIEARISEQESDVRPSEPYQGIDDMMGGIPGFEPSVDRTDIGDQYVVPGAGRISDREMAERQGQKPMRGAAEQKAADEGLFDVEGRKQKDMFVRDLDQERVLEEARNTTTGPSWFERGLPLIEAPMPKGKRSYTTYWTEWKDAGDGYASRAGINLPRLEIRTPEGDVVVRGWGTDGVEYNEIETGGWPTGERLRQVEDRMQALRDRAMRPKVQGKFAIGSRPSETRAGSSSGNENVSATIQTRPETSQQRAQATESLRQILRKLAGDKVDVKVVDRIVGDDANFDDAGGFYTADEGRRLIYIALASPEEMAAVLRHEVIHALRDLGIIGPKDWRTLENQAAGWRKKYQTDKYYGGLGLSQEKLNEEAIAEAYADWVRGQYKPTSVVENVFRQIKAFFEALRNWAQGNGWNTAEDVFGAIEGGGMNQAEFDRTPLTRNNAFAMSRAAIKQQASGVLDMIKNIGATMDRLNNPLVTLPGDWRNYFEMRGMAKGEIQRIQDHLAGMRDLIGLPKAERDAALRFMTTKGAAPSLITDPQKRAKFVEMKQEIVKLGQQLVDAGMLNEATFRANKDSYLPRVYLKFVLDEAANRKGVGTGARVSQQGYLKQRQDIPEDVRKLVYGEIDDPGFLAVRSISVVATDLAKFKLLQQVSDNPDWVANPKDQFVEFRKKKYTPQALKAQADQLRRMVDQLPEDRRAGSLKMALEMEKLANTKLQAQPEFSKDYKQIPDTARYGSLRGLWVRKEIFNDMIGTFAVPNPDPSWAEQVLGMGGWATKATQWWKFGKVVANPPSIARNLMSGMIQSNVFGRIPFAYVPMRYTQAIQEILKNGKHWQAAQKFGIKGSGFAQNESAKIERAFLAYQKQQGGTATVRNLARFKDMIAHVVDIASDGYQFIESVGKVAVIIDAMERQGLSERDAVILAEEAQFDYSNVSPAVRYLRNSPIGMPFVTYMSKVAPQLIKTAATRPWAFGPYLAMAVGLPMLTQYMLDIDDDDLDRLKKTLPKWAQETGSVYLLPFKDSAGRWHYWNAGYVLPWGQFQDAAYKAYAGKPLEAAKGMGMFGAPLVSLMTAVQTGIDPFTQRPIYNKADPPGRQWRDISLYLWSMSMPPWVGSTGFAKKLHDAALDVPIDKQGNPSVTMTQALSGVFGISLYGLDPDVNRQKNLAQMKYEIDEIKRRRGSIAKDARLKPADKKAYLDEINTHIAEKSKAMAEYARETNVNPKLRVQPAARQ